MEERNSRKLLSCLVAAVFLLSACGGGSSVSVTPPSAQTDRSAASDVVPAGDEQSGTETSGDVAMADTSPSTQPADGVLSDEALLDIARRGGRSGDRRDAGPPGSATGGAAGGGTADASTPAPGPVAPGVSPVLSAAAMSHEGFYDTYEGSKTCRRCHLEETQQAHAAVHYQWVGPTPHVTNMQVGGKLGGINDFCGFPDINWIGLMTNLDGATIDGGCATCHAGMGGKPDPDFNAAGQADNVDCLVCHSDSYRRKVERQADGTFHFVPAPERMTVPLLTAITMIDPVPTRGSCVNCHSYAGGGCNNKRGDLEEAHREPPSAQFDVHMASTAIGGAGLICTDCHTSSNHRIAGRGTDLRPTDLDVPVRCQNCHGNSPHGAADLNRHTARVDCTVCHIPRFAKIVSTDMVRDFSKPAMIDEAKRIYEPNIERQANVIPEYRFFNGTSYIYQFGEPAAVGPSGRVSMAEPLGDRNDPSAKLFAFKHHLAVQPIEPMTRRLLPMKMGILFQTGDVDATIKQGALEVGWDLSQGYEFIPSERYMGIFHEVSPANEALRCDDCHGSGTRVDFAALGYTPRTERNGRPLCGSCHGDESGEWSPAELFTEVHQEHVRGEGINCGECHAFAADAGSGGGGGGGGGAGGSGDDEESDDDEEDDEESSDDDEKDDDKEKDDD